MAVLGMTAGTAQAMSGQTTGEGSWPELDGTHALRLQANVDGGHVTYMVNGLQEWKGTVTNYKRSEAGNVAEMDVTAPGQAWTTAHLVIYDNGPGQSTAPDGVQLTYDNGTAENESLDAGNYTIH
jgi:hypothetical protein